MRTKSLIVLFAGLVLAALCHIASAQTVPVNANLVDGSGNPVPGAYLHFDLYNCGPNYPTLNNPATITSFSITTNVVTFLANNTFAVGTPVVVKGLTTGTYLNGQTLTVLSSGLSGTQFEANFTHANVGATSDSGTATPNGLVVVQRSFDLQQSSLGVISGTVIPNDLIACGNPTSINTPTQWTVTPMKSGATPLNAAQRYFICSPLASGTPPCAQASAGGVFNPSTAQPAQIVPQPPGFSLLFANPVATQSLVQPEGTQMNYGGVQNFCSATVLCGSGSDTVQITVNGGPALTAPVNFQNGTNTTASNPSGSNVQYNVASATNSVLGLLELTGDLGGAATAPTVVNGSHITNSSIPNSGLVNPSLTVTAGAGLSGGGSVALGSAITINIATGGVTNAMLANPSTTVDGVVCTLGSTCTIPATAILPTAQIGDTIAYNVYGDSKWDAVLGAPRNFATIFQSIDNGAPTAYGVISGVNHSGNIANVFATATDTAAQTFSATASASTSTVIGEDAGEGANYTQFGFGSFYRWSNKFAAGNTTNVRYWMGLTNYNTALTGCAAQSVRGNTCFAADYPSTFSIAFRFSAGTDVHWQAVTQTQSAQTVVDTGVAIDTNSHLFEFTNSGSAVNYFIDGTLVATITTNIPSSVGSSGYTPAMFWVGDNKNTATAISANEYWMTMTLK